MKQIFDKTLTNGLRVLIDENDSSPLVTVNVLYKVGSKNERENKTGFAHLFEHFMFEGSKNIPSYDSELQKAGGDNNAFTTSDLTNYYCTLPATNIETALWLESDRMLELDFNQESLNTQISVVMEEFKQNYLNKPYGDVWHLLMDLCFTVHPYKWPTIGKKLSHIEAITLQETKDFFYTYYRPNNAILSIVGGVKADAVFPLVEKWFGDIPHGKEIAASNLEEPEQTAARFMEVERDVPHAVLYKAYHACHRTHKDYYALDVLSDLLGSGESSLLHRHFIDELDMCTDVDCYISGTDDVNLFIFEMRPTDDYTLDQLDEALEAFINQFLLNELPMRTLEKTINKACNYVAFTNESIGNLAFNLAFFTSIDKPELYANEDNAYKEVSLSQIMEVANTIMQKQKSNTLFYQKQHND